MYEMKYLTHQVDEKKIRSHKILFVQSVDQGTIQYSVIFQKELIAMKNILLVFLLMLNYNKANRELKKWILEDEKQAVADLSEQLVNAMHDYISECNIIPIGKSCYSNIRSMDTIKSDISDKKESVKILVWNKDLEIVEALSLSNYKSEEIDKFKEVVLLIHDMGESSCSNKTKKLITSYWSFT